jgi:hypothetical protein
MFHLELALYACVNNFESGPAPGFKLPQRKQKYRKRMEVFRSCWSAKGVCFHSGYLVFDAKFRQSVITSWWGGLFRLRNVTIVSQVKVTLQLTISHYVKVSSPFWVLWPDITFCPKVVFWNLLSFLFGAPSLTRGRV